MEDELSTYLRGIDREDPWRVDAVLKRGSLETTERVYFVGKSGAELGPFVRKRLAPGLGDVYERVLEAQRGGRRTPHLPRIVECCRQDGGLVVVMEHVAGETLAKAVASSNDRLDLVRRVFPALCEAVTELHGLFSPPVIHRDLKPGNVMVSGGAVTLIDLGIARSYREGAEHDTTHFGTRSYAPPEQFGFGQTDVTSDVYALGMLLFFCLTGRDPAASDRERGFADKGVPEALRAVIARAADLDPSKRFPSVRAFERALLDALPDVPAESDCPSEPPAFERPGLGERLGSLLARVPEPVGAAWDVLCALFLLVLLAGCVMAIVDPTPENASWPLWYLVWSYLAFMAPEFAIVAYLLMDRRPLRRAVPRLSRLAVRSEVRAGLLAMLALLVAWIVATMVMQAA